ncbi:MAG: S49 family peptidase, partial [Tannerellaceae bacterium]|nr:S49 family peptidase [Tannerellaceae bacterium]
CFPPSLSGSQIQPLSFWDDFPSYKEQSEKALQALIREFKIMNEAASISISMDFENEEIPEGTIAFHRIKGTILAEAYYWFSTKQLEQDLLTADSNPGFSCHFLYINSGGGEAWYLDRLSETLHSLEKPVYVLFEKAGCSAAYYIGCHGNIIKSLTQNDSIGCIVTVVGFLNFDGYFEQLGIKHIEEYAHRSTLKNKKYNDLRDGSPEQYIKEELDPLCEQFINEVKLSRPVLQNLPEDDPVFQGETFSATNAQEKDLIDGLASFPEAIREAHQLGQQWLEHKNTQNRITQYL